MTRIGEAARAVEVQDDDAAGLGIGRGRGRAEHGGSESEAEGLGGDRHGRGSFGGGGGEVLVKRSSAYWPHQQLQLVVEPAFPEMLTVLFGTQ